MCASVLASLALSWTVLLQEKIRLSQIDRGSLGQAFQVQEQTCKALNFCDSLRSGLSGESVEAIEILGAMLEEVV
jgi:hypothetical protein